MDQVVQHIGSIRIMEAVSGQLLKDNQKIILNNVNESVNAILIANLFTQNNDRIIIVSPNLFQAQKTYDQLVQIVGGDHVHFFPMDEFISAEMLASSHEFRHERINTIVNILENKKGIVITHMIGAIRMLPPKHIMEKSIVKLNTGSIHEFDKIVQQCITMGYHRQTVVENQGEIAIRGGIIDIFPFTADHPYRIEFFDDEIDSIRSFDERSGDQRDLH